MWCRQLSTSSWSSCGAPGSASDPMPAGFACCRRMEPESRWSTCSTGTRILRPMLSGLSGRPRSNHTLELRNNYILFMALDSLPPMRPPNPRSSSSSLVPAHSRSLATLSKARSVSPFSPYTIISSHSFYGCAMLIWVRPVCDRPTMLLHSIFSTSI